MAQRDLSACNPGGPSDEQTFSKDLSSGESAIGGLPTLVDVKDGKIVRNPPLPLQLEARRPRALSLSDEGPRQDRRAERRAEHRPEVDLVRWSR